MTQLSFDEIEIWLPVLGCEGRYEVSSLGKVRSLPAWRSRAGNVLKPRAGSHGYLTVALRPVANGSLKVRTIHSLVTEAFHGPRPAGMVTRHLDGDRQNNRADNLTWGTYRENGLDETRHGRNHNANKTHCPHGHEFTPENTKRRRTGGRDCRTCIAAAGRRRRERTKNAA